MKIITWNVNGYRSAESSHSVKTLVTKYQPDIVCLQELKMNSEIPDSFGYVPFYNFAQKRGYSGTLILTKEEPLHVTYQLGLDQFDHEGRFIMLEFQHFYVINIYIPHGGRKKENHPYKFLAINKLLALVKNLKKEVFICTDFNIAHTELDVKNYKTNYKNNMFSYEERAKIDELLSLGLVDSFRCLEKNGDIYSMWPNGFNARERNMGWRIDYIFVSESLKNQIKSVKYLKDHLGSDHCPYVLELESGEENEKV